MHSLTFSNGRFSPGQYLGFSSWSYCILHLCATEASVIRGTGTVYSLFRLQQRQLSELTMVNTPQVSMYVLANITKGKYKLKSFE